MKSNNDQKASDNKTTDNSNNKNIDKYFSDNQKTEKAGIYTVDITGSYLNPLTGVTADGGTKNAAIGEGMVQGVISPINSGGDISEAMKINQVAKNVGLKHCYNVLMMENYMLLFVFT